jgi:trans-aconitate methyltransferase
MAKMSYEHGAKAEWNHLSENYKPRELQDSDIPFRELFERYLPTDSTRTCIEIGGVPGNFLWYLNKKFHYAITGLDFNDNEQFFHANMATNGIPEYEFIKADFLEWESTELYDVVTSFGFVEHFNNFDEIIVKHCRLVAPRGFLVITMPNFRYLQWLYHRIFDRRNLKIHNTDVMSPSVLDRIIGEQGLERLFCGYVGNLAVWRESSLHGVPAWIDAKIRGFARCHGGRFPTNRLYAPYIAGFYRRR